LSNQYPKLDALLPVDNRHRTSAPGEQRDESEKKEKRCRTAARRAAAVVFGTVVDDGQAVGA